MGIYTNSVAVNQRWADAQTMRAQVEVAAQEVNAPGNDVFDTHEAAAERSLRDAALKQFNRDFDELRQFLSSESSDSERAALYPALEGVSGAMAEMLAEADLIFSLFAAGDHVAAGGHMASMDRRYAVLNHELRKVGAVIADIQAKNFQLQIEHAEELRRYEFGIGGLIVLMVLGVTVYGHRIAHEMRANEAERDSSMQAIQASEDRFRNLVANVPGVVCQLQRAADGEIAITYASERLRELSGLSPEEILADATKLVGAVHTEDQLAVRQFLARSPADVSTWEHEFRIVTRTGELKWVRAIARPRVSSEGAQLWDGLIFDITKSKIQAEQNRALEAKLRQTQKLEALGTLSGGIAHEFNNMLTPILGLTELSMVTLPRDSREYRNLKTVVTSAERAVQMIDKILTFTRPKDATLAAISIVDTVAEAVELLQVTKPSTITIRTDLEPAVGKVLADETQIQQIIMNLASNARDAMASKVGTLVIELRRVAIETALNGERFTLPPGAYAKLAMTDTGHGMETSVLSRIFEPFFTTKAVGEGTGLGLSVIHGIVDSLGGAIEVSSTPGVGSRFDVYFPLHSDIPDQHEADGSTVADRLHQMAQ